MVLVLLKVEYREIFSPLYILHLDQHLLANILIGIKLNEPEYYLDLKLATVFPLPTIFQ